MSEKVSVYYLEVHDPSAGKNQVRVHGEVSIGSARNNSVCIADTELAPKHCIFRVHQEILTVFQVAESGTTKIGRQTLETGRMYILEKGDKLHLGELKVVIRLEKEIIDEDLEEDNAEITDPDLVNTATVNVTNDDEDDNSSEEKISFFSRLKNRFKRQTSEAEPTSDLEELDNEIEQEEDKSVDINESIYIPRAKLNEDDEEKKPQKKKKSRRRYISREDMPAFFPRLYGFCAEIIISFAFVANVSPILELGDIYSQIVSDLTPYIQKGLGFAAPYLGEHINLIQFLVAPSFIAVVITWFAINLASSVLTGAPIGLALQSVRTEGSFVSARLKAIIRLFLSLFTLPTLITELPALIKRRTLKEVITGSELSYRHPFLKIVGVLIVLPAFTIATVILPGLMTPEVLETPMLIRNIEVSDKKLDGTVVTHPLRVLKLALSYQQEARGEWAVSPFLTRHKNHIAGGVNLLRSRGEKVDIVRISPFSSQAIETSRLVAITTIDPFFDSKYPQLAAQISSGTFSSESDTDLTNLIIDALAINWDELPKFLSERGPILTPYLELKKNLTELFAINSQVETFILGRHTFLRFSVSPNSYRYMTVLDSKVVSFDLSSRSGGEVAITRFTRAFFSSATPLMDNAVAPPAETTNWTFFDWLDYFNSGSIDASKDLNLGLVPFYSKVLQSRENQPWAQDTINNDYIRSMKLLQEYSADPNNSWAGLLYNAMNIDQSLMQDAQNQEAP